MSSKIDEALLQGIALLISGFIIFKTAFSIAKNIFIELTGTFLDKIYNETNIIIIGLIVAGLLLLFFKKRISPASDLAWEITIKENSSSKKQLYTVLMILEEKARTWNTNIYIVYSLKGKNVVLYVPKVSEKGIREYIEAILKLGQPYISFKRIKINCNQIFKRNKNNDNYAQDYLVEISDFISDNTNISIEREFSRNDVIPVGISSSNTVVYLTKKDVKRHIGIFGSTGSGKTNTASNLALNLSKKGFSVLIMDWHGEYGGLLSFSSNIKNVNPLHDFLGINPFVINKNIESIVDVFTDVLELSRPQQAVFLRFIKENKKRINNIFDLLFLLDSIDIEGYWERELRAAILRRLEILNSPEGRILFGDKRTDFLPPNGYIYVINLSSIESYFVRRLYSLFLLREIYELALEGKVSNLVIIIDEAHNILPKETDNFVSRMIAEVRKYGVSFIIVTQSPSSVNIEFLKNINTKIIHSIKVGVDKKIIEESMVLHPFLQERIPRLEVGEAIFFSPTFSEPLIIRISSIKSLKEDFLQSQR